MSYTLKFTACIFTITYMYISYLKCECGALIQNVNRILVEKYLSASMSSPDVNFHGMLSIATIVTVKAFEARDDPALVLAMPSQVAPRRVRLSTFCANITFGF